MKSARKRRQPQAVIRRLADRRRVGDDGERVREPYTCTLGEGTGAHARPCPCRPPAEFPLDEEIAGLIEAGIFCAPTLCPYDVITSHLVMRLTVGPEAFRARDDRVADVDAVRELGMALNRLESVRRLTKLDPGEIAQLAEEERDEERSRQLNRPTDEPRPQHHVPFHLLDQAERLLNEAVQAFKRLPTPAKRRRGPAGRLHVQAISGALVEAWKVLTGTAPSKNNVAFQGLLAAATETIFGLDADRQPDWEGAIRFARNKIRDR